MLAWYFAFFVNIISKLFYKVIVALWMSYLGWFLVLPFKAAFTTSLYLEVVAIVLIF